MGCFLPPVARPRDHPRARCCCAICSEIQCISSYLEISMAETTTMVHVRVNEKIKAQATKALTAMGLSVSDAVRVFLTRVAADKQLPFELKVPNAETRAAMHEARAMGNARFSSADELIRELDKDTRR
jgi:DNA-damage-inducible protein J